MLCQICRDGHNIHRCKGCDTLLCSVHRWSTGRESDGYFCVKSCTPTLPVVTAPTRAPLAWSSAAVVFLRQKLKRRGWPYLDDICHPRP